MKKIFVETEDVIQIVVGHLRSKGLDVDAEYAVCCITAAGMFTSTTATFDGIEFHLIGVQGKGEL